MVHTVLQRLYLSMMIVNSICLYRVQKLQSFVLGNYMIVATYSFFEKSLKSILKLTDDLTENELRSMYRIAQIKTLIISKYSIMYK